MEDFGPVLSSSHDSNSIFKTTGRNFQFKYCDSEKFEQIIEKVQHDLLKEKLETKSQVFGSSQKCSSTSFIGKKNSIQIISKQFSEVCLPTAKYSVNNFNKDLRFKGTEEFTLNINSIELSNHASERTLPVFENRNCNNILQAAKTSIHDFVETMFNEVMVNIPETEVKTSSKKLKNNRKKSPKNNTRKKPVSDNHVRAVWVPVNSENENLHSETEEPSEDWSSFHNKFKVGLIAQNSSYQSSTDASIYRSSSTDEIETNRFERKSKVKRGKGTEFRKFVQENESINNSNKCEEELFDILLKEMETVSSQNDLENSDLINKKESTKKMPLRSDRSEMSDCKFFENFVTISKWEGELNNLTNSRCKRTELSELMGKRIKKKTGRNTSSCESIMKTTSDDSNKSKTDEITDYNSVKIPNMNLILPSNPSEASNINKISVKTQTSDDISLCEDAIKRENLNILSKITFYQQKILLLLDTITQTVSHIPQLDDLDRKRRESRAIEFVSSFSRNHLHPIEKMIREIHSISEVDQIKTVKKFPLMICNLFGLIYQAIKYYQRFLYKFITDKNPKKLKNLLETITFTSRMCTEKNVFSIDDMIVANLSKKCKTMTIDLEKAPVSDIKCKQEPKKRKKEWIGPYTTKVANRPKLMKKKNLSMYDHVLPQTVARKKQTK